MRIKMKDFELIDEDSIRIARQTREACERLNLFLSDFKETSQILSEAPRNQAERVAESIAFIDTKIAEIESAMRQIAARMPGLIEIIEE